MGAREQKERPLVGKRTKVGEVVGRKVISAFGLLRDVAALLHFVHQRAGETHTRSCGASGKVTGLGWRGLGGQEGAERMGRKS